MNRGLALSLALLAVFLPLSGCGGGGSHGSGGNGVLSLSFDASAGTATGPTGTSHHIVVYRSDGTVVDEQTVDLSSGTRQVNLTNLPSGTLRLHVGLSTTTGGSEVGSVDTTFTGGTAAGPFSIVMKQDVASVVVAPTSATVKAGFTSQLYPLAKTSSGAFVYTAPTDWTWSSDLPAFATVNGTGTVTGVAEGGATVTATHTPSSLSASSTIGVISDAATRSKWTVLVFMNAANSLYQEAEDNLNQMEKIANNPDVRFVVQWKQIDRTTDPDAGRAANSDWIGTRRYLATYDTTSLGLDHNPIKSTLVQDLGQGVDMGSGDALTNFVAWGKANFPADHYVLVMWDHGDGWFSDRARTSIQSRSISQDGETGNIMTVWDVRNALSGQHFDILACDACMMQSAEDLIEFSDNADYIVGSEENTPGPGYPYHLVFKPFVDSPDTAVPDLAKNLVTAFQSYYSGRSGITWPTHQSVIDVSKVATFRTALDNFAVSLTNNASAVGPIMNAARTASTRIPKTESFYSYYDLDQITAQIEARTTGAPSIAATNLRAAISDMVVISQTSSDGTFMKGLSIEFARSTGVRGFNGSYGAHYGQLRMAALTHWDEFLSNTTANP